MAWVQVIDEDEATGELASAYERIREARGRIGNVVKITSLLPAVMEANIEFYKALMFGDHALPRADREMVAVEVSRANCTDYCMAHHSAALAVAMEDDGAARAFMRGEARDLTPRQEAMLTYARKLAAAPQEITKGDIEALQVAGLADQEIVAVNHIVGYFSLMNRVAAGLGVELEPDAGAHADYKY
ncbi:MAG: peroxidase-related enzyme [Thermoplasmatota archaeon]